MGGFKADVNSLVPSELSAKVNPVTRPMMPTRAAPEVAGHSQGCKPPVRSHPSIIRNSRQ